jgi:hypothetical protein
VRSERVREGGREGGRESSGGSGAWETGRRGRVAAGVGVESCQQ